jgi:hypothetical protein
MPGPFRGRNVSPATPQVNRRPGNQSFPEAARSGAAGAIGPDRLTVVNRLFLGHALVIGWIADGVELRLAG